LKVNQQAAANNRRWSRLGKWYNGAAGLFTPRLLPGGRTTLKQCATEITGMTVMRQQLMELGRKRRVACLLGGLLALGCWSASAFADDSAPEENAEKASATAENEPTVVDPAEVERLVRALDDDRYAVREAAQKQLMSIGAQALEAVAKVAVSGSLESSTRAVSVLLAWAESKDGKLSEAALERIARLESRPIEAAMAAERLAEIREGEAIEAIKSLGGRFDYDRTFGIAGGTRPPIQVILGPQWKGGTEGLHHLASIRGITTLSLWSAPLDDSAAEDLMALPQLRKLDLYGTSLSEESIAKIKNKLPQTFIDVRPGGARLGIRGINCEEVLKDSPAQKSGIKPQDRIIEFAGQPLDQAKSQAEQFEELTKLISECKPGDSKPIKVARRNLQAGAADTVELKVTFDRWGDDTRPTSGLGNGQDPFGARQGVPRTIILQPRPAGVPRPVLIPGGQFQPNQR
jgi:hypothetical protein